MQVTFYRKPDGRQEVIDVVNVDPADQQWFEDRDAVLSMEDIGGMYAMYADIGLTDEDGESLEVMVLSMGKDCVSTIAELRNECVRMLEEETE